MKKAIKSQGDTLRDMRKAAGLTQQQLAEKSGISVTTISRYEDGLRINTVDTITQLLRALNTAARTANRRHKDWTADNLMENY